MITLVFLEVENSIYESELPEIKSGALRFWGNTPYENAVDAVNCVSTYTDSINDCNTSLGKDAMNRVSTNGVFVALFF